MFAHSLQFFVFFDTDPCLLITDIIYLLYNIPEIEFTELHELPEVLYIDSTHNVAKSRFTVLWFYIAFQVLIRVCI